MNVRQSVQSSKKFMKCVYQGLLDTISFSILAYHQHGYVYKQTDKY